MKTYKVILKLMVDPTISDRTFDVEYQVNAENEYRAFRLAEEKQSDDLPNIKYQTIFDYKIIEL